MSVYLQLLEERFGADLLHAVTTRPGEESELADKALSEDVDLVVAVGGDGTWSNVADRLVASGRDDVALGLLPAGTGNDFGRNFGLHRRELHDAVRALADAEIRSVDVGRVAGPLVKATNGARASTRHFLNLVGFGFDVAVIDAVAGARILKGALLYKVTALQQLFRFDGFSIDLESEQPSVSGRHLMLTISNGPFFGGSIPIAPAAEIDDGILDACAIGDASPLGRLRLFNLAERGKHVLDHRVRTRRSGSFEVRFEAPPRLEIDGDVWESESETVVVDVVSRGLRVVGG